MERPCPFGWSPEPGASAEHQQSWPQAPAIEPLIHPLALAATVVVDPQEGMGRGESRQPLTHDLESSASKSAFPMRSSPATCAPLGKLLALVALLLATLWLPVTSHEFLESAGLIHQAGLPGDAGPSHDAADGLCQPADAATTLRAPTFLCLPWLVALLEFVVVVVIPGTAIAGCHRPARPGDEARGRPWHFALRQAVPGRAPAPTA